MLEFSPRERKQELEPPWEELCTSWPLRSCRALIYGLVVLTRPA